jgi:hypothetical protein
VQKERTVDIICRKGRSEKEGGNYAGNENHSPQEMMTGILCNTYM